MKRMFCCVAGITVALAVGFAPVGAQELFSGIDPDGFDPSVRPQDDLYRHVNGRWLLRTQIPPDKSNYGAFTELDDAAKENVRRIIEDAAKHPQNENERKVADFYKSFMDTQRIEQRGVDPVRPALNAIEGLNDMRDVFRHMGHLQSIGIGGPVAFFVTIDAKDSSQYLAAIFQSGITLPDRDYYLEDDEEYVHARKALQDYIARLYALADVPYTETDAAEVVRLETELAAVQWPRTEVRNAEKRYNKYAVADLSQLTPELPWDDFFEAVGAPDLAEINVMTPDFFQGLEKIGGETSLRTAKAYLTFRVLDSAAPYLTEPFADAHFELHRKQLAGVPEQQPRWKRAVDATSGAGAGDFGVLGDVVGQLYVARHFKPEARRRMDELVANLLKAYELSIGELTWMTAATRQKALEKLHKITPKIGYTQKWRDYSDLEIKSDDLIGNMVRSAQHEHRRMLKKLGQPVDRTEWGMTPQTVNAYYNPTRNEIVFPAAILQPPFFTADADAAANYGGIGAVIGHEISHGFDDQGSKYDGNGNLQNWWSEEDRAAFEKLAGRLVEQFESYEALPGRRLNGKLTLGENIADLSGLAIAYKAYMLSLGGRKAPVIDGHTGPQRFFFGWAQVWRRLYREQELRRRLATDPHSPSAFRANGPVSNMDAFYEAFDVKPADRMYRKPEDRIRIW